MNVNIGTVCSIIACMIGVLTFVVGMNSRSKEDGILLQKIDQALDGIEDLKKDLKEVSQNEHTLELLVRSHDEQIKTLFNTMNNVSVQNEALLGILTVLRNKEEKNETNPK